MGMAPGSAAPPSSASWTRVRPLAAVLLLLCLFVGVRALFLDADPPLLLPGRYMLRELVVEPIAKASEARNHALFGAWTPNPADEYQFWRPQSPVWVYPLAGFMSLFGAGSVQLRAFAILLCGLGYLAYLFVARQQLKGVAFLAAALFPALDGVHVLYSRSGLLEPIVNAWITVAILCLLLSWRHWAFQLAAQWAFVLAFFTKAAAAYAFPLILVVSGWLLVRCPAAKDRRLARGLVIAHALVLGAASVAYLTSDFYVRTLIWNFNHVLLDKDQGSSFLTGSLTLERVLRSATNGYKWGTLGMVAPITGPLALIEVGMVAVALLRRRSVAAWRLIVTGWVLSALLALLVISLERNTLRFNTILVAPASLAAASALANLSPAFHLRRPYLPAVVLAAFGVLNGWMLSRIWGERRYETLAMAQAVREAIGPRRAAIVGYWSAPVVFDTPYEHYYVKRPFNVSERITKLGITDAILAEREPDYRGDPINVVLRKYFPRSKAKAKARLIRPLRSVQLGLYTFKKPLTQVEPPKEPR